MRWVEVRVDCGNYSLVHIGPAVVSRFRQTMRDSTRSMPSEVGSVDCLLAVPRDCRTEAQLILLTPPGSIAPGSGQIRPLTVISCPVRGTKRWYRHTATLTPEQSTCESDFPLLYDELRRRAVQCAESEPCLPGLRTKCEPPCLPLCLETSTAPFPIRSPHQENALCGLCRPTPALLCRTSTRSKTPPTRRRIEDGALRGETGGILFVCLWNPLRKSENEGTDLPEAEFFFIFLPKRYAAPRGTLPAKILSILQLFFYLNFYFILL